MYHQCMNNVCDIIKGLLSYVFHANKIFSPFDSSWPIKDWASLLFSLKLSVFKQHLCKVMFNFVT